MLGGLLVSLGMMAASFARTIVDMYIAIGLVSGNYQFQLFIPQRYFIDLNQVNFATHSIHI